ncbi:MAG: histidine phosphatase family protein, partial [Lutibacter sp.]|nr:histidine phosphatase family protein [Lutibacter sp.]
MLYIIRHGQTDFNRDGIAQGQMSTPLLTEKGQNQILKVAQHLSNKGIKFDQAFSSDLKRAIQSLEIIQKHIIFPKVTLDRNLRENDQGELSGQSYKSVKWTQYQELLSSGKTEFPMFSPQPESPIKIRERVFQFFKKIPISENTLVVTHGGIIRNYLALLKNITLEDY